MSEVANDSSDPEPGDVASRPATSTRLVFVGVATWDAIALVDRFPEPDERVVASEIVHAGGGPAATAAVAASRLGRRVAFIGTVGDDDAGSAVRDGLEAEGVDVSGIGVADGAESAASLVIVDASRSTRAIVNRPPPRLELSDRARALLAQAAWVHVDQTGWGAVHEWWRRSSNGPRLSVDAGNRVDRFDPAGVDLYVPTVAALRHRYGKLSRVDLLGRAIDEGARLVVATDGSAGSCALGRDGAVVTAAAAPGLIRSTLGAGDVFHGALLAATEYGLHLDQRLQYANLVASRSCEGLDGRSAIPGHDEVMAALLVPSVGGSSVS